jgi:superfamily II DNA or RNA helicase
VDTPVHAHAELSALGHLERDVAAVLALTGDAVSRSGWTDWVSQCGIRSNRRRAISVKEMLPLCERLVAAGVVTRVPQGGQQVVYDIVPDMALWVLEDLHRRGRLNELERVIVPAETRSLYWYSRNWRAAHRARARAALVRGQWDRVAAICAEAKALWQGSSAEHGQWVLSIIGSRPQRSWLDALHDDAREAYCKELLTAGVEQLVCCSDVVLQWVCENGARPLKLMAARYLVLTGRGDEAREIRGMTTATTAVIDFIDAFWRGDLEKAHELGDAALAKRTGKQLPDLEGVCHALSRVYAAGQGVPGAWDAVRQSIKSGYQKKRWSGIYVMLEMFRAAASGQTVHEYGLTGAHSWLDVLVIGLSHQWIGRTPTPRLRAALEHWSQVASTSEQFGIPSRELNALREAIERGEPVEGTLTAAYRARAAWELALDGLEGVGQTWGTERKAPEPKDDRHLVWELQLASYDELPDGSRCNQFASVTPRLIESQRSRKGKKLSVSKLLEGQRSTWVTEEDRRVLRAITAETIANARSYRTSIDLGNEVLPALVGNPRVIFADGTPAEVVAGDVSIVAESKDERTVLRLEPAQLVDVPIMWREEEGGRVVVFSRSRELERVLEIMRGGRLEVPKSGAARVGRVLASLSRRIPVRTDGRVDVVGRQVEATRGIVAQLHWDGTALRVALRVAPLGAAGPHLVVGEGEATVIAEVEGELLRTARNFDEESSELTALIEASPTLASLMVGRHAAHAAGLEAAYEVLLELADAPGASIAWPRGKKLGLPLRRDVHDLSMRVGTKTSWLDVSAKLTVDEGKVLGFAELLRRRLGDGRFIRLDDERVLALTAELARRLDTLGRLGKSKKDGVRIHSAVLPFVAELGTGLGSLEIDDAATSALARVREAEQFEPRVPRGFGSILRPYQREGFVWLARLARAGLGACLADDMGLGKTVQALALLSARASEGPALVIAPTSVVHNWVQEARRFAPLLRVTDLASTDRTAYIEASGNRDVIVCSYGLLVTETEALTKKRFATVVLDEAHAVKNTKTRRTQAAFALQADFRLALTGTPIENHLGELWSVMEAAVPGLLGDESEFEKNVAGPIVKGNRQASVYLRKVLRPFILRRTRGQVLDELPDRTDVVIEVEPRADEAAWYEAMRRRALKAIAKSSKDKGGKARLRLLAEITRLRQAAVDPRLVDDEKAPSGAKIEAVVQRVEALRAEGHRALVFTQFLGAMELLRKRFDAAGIEYLELEGATPAKDRAERIEAFQSGQGDVFLMSLRAGGIGVNLTGADYVIHVDPWWNPAVEDQATARAHRMGQTRPVTVYRLVTRATIEERIVALHETKRELAEDLLDGMQNSRKLSLDELRELLEPQP